MIRTYASSPPTERSSPEDPHLGVCLRRADVDLERAAPGDRMRQAADGPEDAVEHRRGPPCPRSADHVAPRQVPLAGPGEVRRDPRDGDRAGRVPLVRLERPDARRPSVGVELHVVSDGERRAAQRSGDDRARPRDREHAIDEQPRPRLGRRRGRGEHVVERRAEVVESLPGRRRHPDRPRHSRARVPSSRSRICSSARSSASRSTRSCFVSATTPPSTPSTSRIARCSSDCWRHPSFAATTNRTRRTGPTPASMLAMNRSCPGTSTKPTSRPDGSSHQA